MIELSLIEELWLVDMWIVYGGLLGCIFVVALRLEVRCDGVSW